MPPAPGIKCKIESVEVEQQTVWLCSVKSSGKRKRSKIIVRKFDGRTSYSGAVGAQNRTADEKRPEWERKCALFAAEKEDISSVERK